jgi:hypothetical protein
VFYPDRPVTSIRIVLVVTLVGVRTAIKMFLKSWIEIVNPDPE